MFTGIIENRGQIREIEKLHEGLRWQIEPKPGFERPYRRGESISVNGVCLTVTTWDKSTFTVEISPETLRCTTLGGMKEGDQLHLERALCVGDSLGGHFVLGHVDGVGKVAKWEKGKEFAVLELQLPKTARGYLAPKGSLTVDGVSLTLNQVRDREDGPMVEFMLVPHTLEQTELETNALKKGEMNIEFDVIARYIAQAVKPYEFH